MLAIYDEILHVSLDDVGLGHSLILDLRAERDQVQDSIRLLSDEQYVETELLIIATSLSHLNDPACPGGVFGTQFTESLKALYVTKPISPYTRTALLQRLPECHELVLWLVSRVRGKIPQHWNLDAYHWGYAGQIAGAYIFSPVCERLDLPIA